MVKNIGSQFYKIYKPHYKLVDLVYSYLYLLIKPFIYFLYLFVNETNCPHHKLGKIKIPKFYSQQSLERIHNFEARDSDILISSYPRSGTHWLAYIVALITHNGQLPEGHKLYDIIKFLGGFIFTDEEVEKMQDPRIFIEHVPYKIYKSVGNKKSKYIYIARNPREVAVSLYKILSTKKPFPNNLLVGFNGTWGQFFDSFIKGETYYGGWFDHVSEWYEHRNDANVLFIWYEELLRDLSGSIIRISGFLDLPISEDLVKNICEKASFEVMKTDKDVKVADFLLLEPSTFFRSGTNRSWEEMFTDEQKSEIDQLMSKYFKREAELF